MKYSKIISHDICNGTGWRVTLYVSGCKRNCPGCFNTCAHNPDVGTDFTQDTKDLIYKYLNKPEIDGLTLLGGEPLSVLSDNRKTVIAFCKEVKEKYPSKTIWLYTGYTFEEVVKDDTMRSIIDYVDVIVDGPFIESLKDTTLKFRGSSNQRILYMKNPES